MLSANAMLSKKCSCQSVASSSGICADEEATALTYSICAGLVHVINKFRVKTLGLAPVRLGNKGPHLLAAHQVTCLSLPFILACCLLCA